MKAWIVGVAMATGLVRGGAAAEPRTPDHPVVHLCERANYAERMLKREHGAAPYATAAEVLAVAEGRAERWATPRCMTGLEYARLDVALRRADEQRRLRAQATRQLARN